MPKARKKELPEDSDFLTHGGCLSNTENNIVK